MNANLVESLTQVILSLLPEERLLLESKLFHEDSEPKTVELMQMTQNNGSFDFLSEEPDLYTLEDGEPI
jgi:hypothetical protein